MRAPTRRNSTVLRHSTSSRALVRLPVSTPSRHSVFNVTVSFASLKRRSRMSRPVGIPSHRASSSSKTWRSSKVTNASASATRRSADSLFTEMRRPSLGGGRSAVPGDTGDSGDSGSTGAAGSADGGCQAAKTSQNSRMSMRLFPSASKRSNMALKSATFRSGSKPNRSFPNSSRSTSPSLFRSMLLKRASGVTPFLLRELEMRANCMVAQNSRLSTCLFLSKSSFSKIA
mmetsp:Transcript_156493/g.276420  ORF Transcript_156493/g.276420 Transcript_156493/m.276420 type:complete len:230 (-) Transcript_156493:258-947(-)